VQSRIEAGNLSCGFETTSSKSCVGAVRIKGHGGANERAKVDKPAI